MLDSQIEEIKNKLNVVDVVGSYIKLTKTGANYRGACPFHSEKKPSFFVSPSRQMWKCFGCGAGHSIFDFVMKIEGIEFGDALKILAEKAGVQLKRENLELKTARQRLYEICDISCRFFEKQLDESLVGKEAKEYLLKRGITGDSIKKWRLGYSPNTWQSLSDFLISKGYTRNEIVSAGLAVVPQDGIPLSGKKEDRDFHSYDRFRGRIIFPIFDLSSQVIGFGARVFKVENEKEVAKYINTPQTLLYDKSNVLYGLNNAKLAIRKNNQCVLTEGYTDAIMCHQAGFENTVAVSGTALTSNHLDILKRYSENLILAFDMDIAGDSATKRGINLAQDKGFNIKIIETYSGAKDPAEIILENSQNWQDFLEKSRSIMDYYFDSAFSNFDKNTPEGKKEIGRIILPAIKRIPNKIEQSHWLQKLAQKLNVSENAIIEELKRVKSETLFHKEEENNFKTKANQKEKFSVDSRKELIEEKVISLILRDPESLNLIEEPHYALFCDKTSIFLQGLKNFVEDQKPATGQINDFKAIFANIASDKELETKTGFETDLKNFLLSLSLRAEIEYEEDGCEEIKLCLLQLKNISAKEGLNKISADIGKAEEEKNHDKVKDLIGEFNKLTKELS